MFYNTQIFLYFIYKHKKKQKADKQYKIKKKYNNKCTWRGKREQFDWVRLDKNKKKNTITRRKSPIKRHTTDIDFRRDYIFLETHEQFLFR